MNAIESAVDPRPSGTPEDELETAAVPRICRKLGVSQATFYVWKKQYAGLGVQELRELRQLRDENGRLEQLVADLSLDRQILQEIVSKKALKPRQRCRLARWAQDAYQIGARRSARLVKAPWTTLLYKSWKKTEEPLRRRLRDLAATHVRYGYLCLTVLLRREGWKVNTKHIYRLYEEENLKVRSVERKRSPVGNEFRRHRRCGRTTAGQRIS